MKPIEDKNPSGVELIDHIKNSLAAHEETYEAGAWERFAEIEDGKKPIGWIWFLRSAAAILVIGLATLLFTLQQPAKENTLQNAKTKALPNKSEQPTDQLVIDSPSIFKDKPSIAQATGSTNIKNVKETVKTTSKFGQSTLTSETQTASASTIKISSSPAVNTQQPVTNLPVTNSTPTPAQVIASVQPNKVAVKDEAQQVKSIEKTGADDNNVQSKLADFLAAETAKNKEKKSEKLLNKKDSKFTLGLVVSPSFGNVKKLNMGYGVSVDYQLSPKFSLNSGLAYNQMSAQGTGLNKNDGLLNSASPASPALFASSNEVKSLESVEERVTGIDIPLEIKYHVNKNFYANVGLSAFAVISQKQNNTYVIDRAVRVVQQSSSLSGKQQVSNVVVSERTTEKETSTADNYNYLGFYNFSLGYKTKIAKTNSMAIEPFVKLPIQKVNTENLNLIGAGLKLKFDF